MVTIERVRAIVGDVLQLGVRRDNLLADSPLLGSLPELDSMAVVALISALEESFGIIIDDDQLDASTFATLGSLSSFVDQRLPD